MKVELLSISDNWQNIKNAAMITIGKTSGKYPDSEWKRKLLLSEHSPIRKLSISWKWIDIPYWVSVHLVRHKIGIEHFVKTQRSDRTGIDRNDLPQGALVTHECQANAQAIITISRKRLCNQASKETREAWQLFLDSFKEKEKELYSVCARECVYRGFCSEFKSCGYDETEEFQLELKNYRNNVAK